MIEYSDLHEGMSYYQLSSMDKKFLEGYRRAHAPMGSYKEPRTHGISRTERWNRENSVVTAEEQDAIRGFYAEIRRLRTSDLNEYDRGALQKWRESQKKLSDDEILGILSEHQKTRMIIHLNDKILPELFTKLREEYSDISEKQFELLFDSVVEKVDMSSNTSDDLYKFEKRFEKIYTAAKKFAEADTQ